MINHADHYLAVVKDELAKVARASGTDISFVGVAVSSTFGPVQVQPGQQALMPAWLLVISLRVELIGVAPIAVPTIIPYQVDSAAGVVHLPDEDDFRGATRQAFSVAIDARNQLMHPAQAPKGAIAGSVVR